MTHELKILPQYYWRVLDGSKTFEIRVNDRGFQKDDEVIMSYYDPIKQIVIPSHKPLHCKIGYVLPVDSERVVFSLLPILRRKPRPPKPTDEGDGTEP